MNFFIIIIIGIGIYIIISIILILLSLFFKINIIIINTMISLILKFIQIWKVKHNKIINFLLHS